MKALVGLLALATTLAVTASASASCLPPGSPTKRLSAADAAFAGTFVGERQEADSTDVLTFDVTDAVKGDLGDRVEVRDALPMTSVSLRPVVGEQLALLLRRTDAGFAANDCDRILPGDLRSATVPIQPEGCRLSRRPKHRYGAHAPERSARFDYQTRPTVIGCGRLGDSGRAFELTGYQLGTRKSSDLCIDFTVLPRGLTSGCGSDRVVGKGDIDFTSVITEPDGRMIVGGATGSRVASVLVIYGRAADGRPGARDATLNRVRRRSLVRRIGARRGFGRWTAELPAGAQTPAVRALDRRGRFLSSREGPAK